MTKLTRAQVNLLIQRGFKIPRQPAASVPSGSERGSAKMMTDEEKNYLTYSGDPYVLDRDDASHVEALAELNKLSANLPQSSTVRPNLDESGYDAAERGDLELATALLAGLSKHGAGDGQAYPNKRYLTGAAEAQARSAIGRLLRCSKPFDSNLRRQLAELFDGLAPSSVDGAPMARRIIFKARRSGKMNETALRYFEIADDYRALRNVDLDHKESVGFICEKYGVEETTVKEARRANPLLDPRAFKRADSRPG